MVVFDVKTLALGKNHEDYSCSPLPTLLASCALHVRSKGQTFRRTKFLGLYSTQPLLGRVDYQFIFQHWLQSHRTFQRSYFHLRSTLYGISLVFSLVLLERRDLYILVLWGIFIFQSSLLWNGIPLTLGTYLVYSFDNQKIVTWANRLLSLG